MMYVSVNTKRVEGTFKNGCMRDLFCTVINDWVRNPGDVGYPTDEENVALPRKHGPSCDSIGDTDRNDIATGTEHEGLHLHKIGRRVWPMYF